jgi:hypothetical protein
MSRKQSLRAWLRTLKKENPKTDEDLREIIGRRTDALKRTGIMSLQSLAVNEIMDESNKFKTILELANVINTIAPQVVNKQSRAKALYGVLRKTARVRFPNDDQGRESPEMTKIYNAMKLNKKYYDNRRALYSETIKRKNENKKRYDGKKLLNVLDSLRNSDNIDNIILLQAASGARISEILSASGFKPSRRLGYIEQSGILKTKDKRNIQKPLLFIKRAEFLERFANVRRANEDGRMISRVNKRLKQLLGITSHALRGIYADLTYRLFADPNKISQAAYVSSVLGHKPGDQETAGSYTVAFVDLDDVNKARRLPDIVRQKEPANPEPIIPRNTNKRDGKTSERLAATVAALHAANIPITNKTLGMYGYGRRAIMEFRKR